MPFCPKCLCEYLDNIEVCPDCEVDLTLELPPGIPEEYAGSEWIELFTFPGTLYANMAIEMLHREGVPSYSQSFYGGAALGPQNAADFVGSTATIYVIEPDLERGREIIEPMIDEMSGDNDDDEQDEE